jgi:hypothetical protein
MAAFPYTLTPLPTLATARTDNADPMFTKSDAENGSPIRTKFRIEIELPAASISNTLVLLPTRRNERIDNELPICKYCITDTRSPHRASVRIEQELARWKKSHTELAPCTRSRSARLRPDPSRPTARVLNVLPYERESRTLSPLPLRKKPRVEIDEPSWKKSSTEIGEAPCPMPTMDNWLPSLRNDRTLHDDPKAANSKTDSFPASRVKLRIESELPNSTFARIDNFCTDPNEPIPSTLELLPHRTTARTLRALP